MIPSLIRLKHLLHELRLKHEVTWGMTRRKDSEIACNSNSNISNSYLMINLREIFMI